MEVNYKNLVNVSFEELHKTFVDAFSDYAVDVSYMTPEVMQNRAIKNGYDPSLSVGANNDNTLVGFTLVGLDEHFEKSSAFDIMTGLVKDFRGKGIASEMFNFIKPSLKKKKVGHFYLEVLQDNKAAIRAYRKSGFKINRSLDCFVLKIKKFSVTTPLRIPLQFSNSDKSRISNYATFSDWEPSWENSFNAIRRIPNDIIILEAKYSINHVGLIVYYPTLNWIMALLVDPKYRHMGVGSALLQKLIEQLNGELNEVKFLNIPGNDEEFISFLKSSGFELILGQYEMIYDLI